MVIRMILLVTEELESGGLADPVCVPLAESDLTFQRLEGAQSFA
jgi:hypothetical protein